MYKKHKRILNHLREAHHVLRRHGLRRPCGVHLRELCARRCERRPHGDDAKEPEHGVCAMRGAGSPGPSRQNGGALQGLDPHTRSATRAARPAQEAARAPWQQRQRAPGSLKALHTAHALGLEPKWLRIPSLAPSLPLSLPPSLPPVPPSAAPLLLPYRGGRWSGEPSEAEGGGPTQELGMAGEETTWRGSAASRKTTPGCGYS